MHYNVSYLTELGSSTHHSWEDEAWLVHALFFFCLYGLYIPNGGMGFTFVFGRLHNTLIPLLAFTWLHECGILLHMFMHGCSSNILFTLCLSLCGSTTCQMHGGKITKIQGSNFEENILLDSRLLWMQYVVLPYLPMVLLWMKENESELLYWWGEILHIYSANRHGSGPFEAPLRGGSSPL